MYSLKRIFIFSLLKFTVLLGGSAVAIIGGRLSLRPPVGGRSSAQDERRNMPAGMNLGTISNRLKRINANSINRMVRIFDFRDRESTETFMMR